VTRSLWLTVVSLVSLLLLVTCGGPGGEDGPPPVVSALSGVIFDGVSGWPLEEATVTLGARRTTTGADGAFRISLADMGGTSSESFSVFHSDYRFLYVEEVTVDGSKSLTVSFPMTRVVESYPVTHTLLGEIREAGGPEIGAGAQIEMMILAEEGGRYQTSFTYDPPGFALETPTSGRDCLVLARVSPPASPPFGVMTGGLDLLAGDFCLLAEPSVVELISLELTPFDPESQSSCWWVTERGLVPGMIDAGDGAEFVAALPGTTTVTLPNPLGWSRMVWRQWREDSAVSAPPAITKEWHNSSGIVSGIPDSFVVPPIDTSLGPEEALDPTSLSFGGGVLSVALPLGGEIVMLSVGDADSGEELGQIVFRGGDVGFPAWLLRHLGGRNLELEVAVLDLSVDSIDLSLIASWDVPPVGYGIVYGSGQRATLEGGFGGIDVTID
jgi:hypothetical protein